MERSPSWCKLWKSSNQGMVIKKKRRKKSRNLNSPESYIKYGTAATLPRGGRPLSQSPRMTLKAPQRSDWKSWTTKPETGLHERVLRQKAILKLFQKKKKKMKPCEIPCGDLGANICFSSLLRPKWTLRLGETQTCSSPWKHHLHSEARGWYHHVLGIVIISVIEKCLLWWRNVSKKCLLQSPGGEERDG